MPEVILEIKDIHAGYDKSEVLHGVSLQVQRGEIVTIVGANGAGKTTTLRSIFGLTSIRSGEIYFAGEKVSGLKAHQLVRKGLSYVPQDHSVFPSLSVIENLKVGAYTLPAADFPGMAEMVFERFPRLKERRTQRAGTLSGGERQMLAIARGLVSKPRLMILDEPSSGLAPLIVLALFERIQSISNSGTTILLVEQNARRALSIANRGYVMELGLITHQGSGQDLLGDEQVQKAYLGGEKAGE